jgi:hypothetical protein
MAVAIDSTLHEQYGMDIISGWQRRGYSLTVIAKITTTGATITTTDTVLSAFAPNALLQATSNS